MGWAGWEGDGVKGRGWFGGKFFGNVLGLGQ